MGSLLEVDGLLERFPLLGLGLSAWGFFDWLGETGEAGREDSELEGQESCPEVSSLDWGLDVVEDGQT